MVVPSCISNRRYTVPSRCLFPQDSSVVTRRTFTASTDGVAAVQREGARGEREDGEWTGQRGALCSSGVDGRRRATGVAR